VPGQPVERKLAAIFAADIAGYSGAITLEQARQKVREWLGLIEKGIDPRAEEARQRAAMQRRQTNTVAAVAAEFLERHAASLKKSAEAKRIIEDEFIKRWGPAPITDVMPEEVPPLSARS
jgi:hypothetical protein